MNVRRGMVACEYGITSAYLQLHLSLPVLETVPVRPRSAKRLRSTSSLSVVDSRCQSYQLHRPFLGITGA